MAERVEVIWYAGHDTKLGRVFAAATTRGLADVSIDSTKEEFLKRLKEKRPAVNLIEDQGRFLRLFEELDGYLCGKPVKFNVPLDLCGTHFELSVWKALKRIPRGRTMSYKEVATLLKKPEAARAVGNACGKNPVPIIIPCHRIIKGNGEMGGYTGGVKIKKTLLETEAAGPLRTRWGYGRQRPRQSPRRAKLRP
jgi:O-6-methylguanine DNA methyltransferase